TLTKYIRPLQRIPAGDFSIRRWMQDEDGGNIWITWREDQRMALEPTIPIWLDLVYAMILTEAPSFNRRLWVVMNELASLGRLNSFEGAVSRGRKHGLCVVGDLQDLVQMDTNFGELHAKSALGCFRSMLALGGANAETTRRVSMMIGEHEVERHPEGVHVDWKRNARDRRHESELVVMPSELANLPDMQGYLMYGKNWPLAKVKFPVKQYRSPTEAFIERMLTADELIEEFEIRGTPMAVDWVSAD
ncbi:type IV secretion system DNA-binding domain-containing protein, partial [Burkholderia cepacia]|uniref:type IV secretion system DNA-binding domain-containing protein n=1 Tax=Burkholderia cepacia TaxID=292 RepID=UPI002ABDC096